MSALHSIGQRVFSSALIVLGAGAGIAHLATVDEPTTPNTPAIVAAAPVHEGDPGFNCATMGNHVCGPGNREGIPAGCYDQGTLVVAWERYDDPTQDTLYGQLASPCTGQAPSQEEESDAAYAAAQTPQDGQVRTVADKTPRPAAGSCSEPIPHPTNTPAPAPQPTTTPRPLVNVNTALVAELDAVPHLGPVLVKRIDDERKVRKFTSIDDLRQRVSRFPSAVVPLVTV
jgi:DNA uptake protein ComE-like DNA-binding protein